jgi:uncharacterized protein YjbJ (UPF0337 family)
MNWSQFETQWNQYHDKMRQHWANLTDDDLKEIGGKRDKLIHRLEKRYGLPKEEATKWADEFVHAQGADEEVVEPRGGL